MQEGAFQITLGGETFDCPPLTIGQTIEMSRHLTDPVEVLRIALEPVLPGITRDQVLAKRGGAKRLNAAVRVVLRAGEFLTEDVPSGEAVPAARPATDTPATETTQTETPTA